MKRYLIALLLTAAFILPAFADAVDVNHFLIFPTVNGESGFINVPSAYVPPSNEITLGLHKFVLKADYSLFNILEAGLNFDFSNTTELLTVFKNGGLNIKGRLLKEEDYFISIAAGLEKLPIDIFESSTGRDFNGFAVVSKKLDDMNLTLGLKKNLTGAHQDNYLMADFSKVINDTILGMLEYDTGKFDLGMKISLNSNLNVELSIVDIMHVKDSKEFGTFLQENFVFGITYIE